MMLQAAAQLEEGITPFSWRAEDYARTACDQCRPRPFSNWQSGLRPCAGGLMVAGIVKKPTSWPGDCASTAAIGSVAAAEA